MNRAYGLAGPPPDPETGQLAGGATEQAAGGDLGQMPIRCSVNGEERQSSVVGDMVFSVPELVSFISRHFTLDPGDIIFTGTPEGVADGRPDQPWLKPGDEVVVEVGRMGRLVNRMVRSE